jgi:hypothetical protein
MSSSSRRENLRFNGKSSSSDELLAIGCWLLAARAQALTIDDLFTIHVSRLTIHVSRLTIQEKCMTPSINAAPSPLNHSPFTIHVSRFTIHASREIYHHPSNPPQPTPSPHHSRLTHDSPLTPHDSRSPPATTVNQRSHHHSTTHHSRFTSHDSREMYPLQLPSTTAAPSPLTTHYSRSGTILVEAKTSRFEPLLLLKA